MKSGRFEIREVLGEGGMGVVYRAFDPVMNREVTVKTIRNPQDKTAIDLFKREISVLATLAHPNIVEIHDIGEIEEAGIRKPYFVMPLLQGTTLDDLIKNGSARLTVERSIRIMNQTCLGLQAAHDRNLVHRDLKPSNIFVLQDDCVKIIDFGVAHLVDKHVTTGLKGTLSYMAPEYLLQKQPTPLSDQFSIAVVCYEMLARRHPFAVPGFRDTTQAILNFTPPPVSDFNPAVSRAMSQVIHKGLAKDPFHRFANVREFSECLQKALRNEPIDIFDPSKLEPRLERVRKALDAGDLDFANEVLRELESEFLDPAINRLRETTNSTRRRTTVESLLETARRRFDDEEFLLALQKIQEVLEIEPANTDARTLQGLIEDKKSSTQIESSLRLAQQHLENHAYLLAHQTIQKVLSLRPKDARAQALLAETDRREQEGLRIRQEKDKTYQAAVECFEQGELTAALSKLERVLELDRRTTDGSSPGQSAAYQKLYDEVRSKRERLDQSCSEVKRSFAEGKLDGALALCEEGLKEFPNSVVLESFKYEIEEAKREEVSAYIAHVEREVAAEADMNRKVSILEAASQKCPQEDRFRNLLERVRLRRDQVQGIVARAMALEESGQYSEALGKWEDLRKIYPQHPGLDVEIERLKQRREQQSRSEAKAQWVTQIDQALGVHGYSAAGSLADQALAEFHDDPELLALKKNAQLGLNRASEASQKLAAGQELLEQGKEEEGFSILREAARLDPQSQTARNVLVGVLLRRARGLLQADWRAAESHVAEAHELDPGNPLAKSLRTLIEDRREDEAITLALSKARECQAQDDQRGAIAELEQALVSYPGRERLEQFRNRILESLPQNERDQLRAQDLQEARRLKEQAMKAEDPKELESIFARTRIYSSKYSGDSDFEETLIGIESRVRPQSERVPALAAGAGQANDRTRFYRTTRGRLAIAAAALLLIFAVIMVSRAVTRRGGGRDSVKAAATQPALIRVVLAGQAQGARIVDAAQSDVTGRAATGLAPGTYTLIAGAEPGFADLRRTFTLAPGETEHTEEVARAPLPVLLTLPAVPYGVWTLDGQPVTLPATELKEAPHELCWTFGANRIQLKFRVKDGNPEIDGWSSTTPLAYGLAASIGRAGLSLSGLNVTKVRYKAGPGPAEVTDAGRVELPLEKLEQQIEFAAAANNVALGRAELVNFKAQAAQLYVFLAPPPVRFAKTKQPEPTPAAPEPKADLRAAEPEPAPAPPLVPPRRALWDRQCEKLKAQGERACEPTLGPRP